MYLIIEWVKELTFVDGLYVGLCVACIVYEIYRPRTMKEKVEQGLKEQWEMRRDPVAYWEKTRKEKEKARAEEKAAWKKYAGIDIDRDEDSIEGF